MLGAELKKKTLILHIGLQKTGTSSLQVMLASNDAALAEAGYSYPALPAGHGAVWHSPFRHNIVAATYADFITTFAKLSPEQAAEFWADLRNSDTTTILSAEEFSRQKDYGALAVPLADFDVTVVVYLRRQDRFAESLYNQRNKLLVQKAEPRILAPETATEQGLFEFLRIEQYIPVLNYRRLLETLEAQLKPARIIVREFDRDRLVGGDVCLDFLDALGLDPARFTMPRHEANESISNVLLQRLVKAAEEKGEAIALTELQILADQIRRGAVVKGPYALLSQQTRRHFLEQYRDINTFVSERYGVTFSGYDGS